MLPLKRSLKSQVFGICCVRGVTQPAGASSEAEGESETDTRKADQENSVKDEEADIRATCQLSDNDKNLVKIIRFIHKVLNESYLN